MKLGVNLKWKELCKELGHDEWIDIWQYKSREARLKKMNKEVTVIKSANTYYQIISTDPAPVIEKFAWQKVKPNQRYGRLTTLEKAEGEGTYSKWYCLCDCGNITKVSVHQLLTGRTKSCGCLFKENCFGNNKRALKENTYETTFEENPELFIQQQRRKLTPTLRYKILKRDNFKCCCCGRTIEDGIKLNIDHIIPVSKGGKTEENNLQTLCWDCNIGKGNSI